MSARFASLQPLPAYGVPLIALLCYGGTVLAFDLAVLAALLFAHVSLGVRSRKHPLHSLHWVAWGAGTWTLLQALLPCGLLRGNEPACTPPPDGIAGAFSLAPYSVYSLDPGNTWVYLVQAAALLLAVSVGTRLVEHGRRLPLTIACAAGAAIVSVITAFHELAGLEKVFGLYRPTSNSHLLSPILNSNHFGAVAAAGVLLCVGLALDTRSRETRPIWFTLAALQTFCVAWSGSRAAALGLVVGSLFLLLTLKRQAGINRRERQWGRHIIVAGTVLAAAAGYFSPLRRSFVEGDLGKLEGIAHSAITILHSPLFGVGRGAFASTYTTLWGNDRPYFPENIVVSWASEWGLPVSIVLALMLGRLLYRSIRRARSGARLCAIAASLSLLTHDLADFALEMTGIAAWAMLVFCMAVVERPRNAGQSSDAEQSRDRDYLEASWPRYLAPLVPAVVLLALGLFGLLSERAESFIMGSAKQERTQLDWRKELAAHPNDPAVQMLGSYRAAKTGESALAAKLANRAMLRAPTWPGPHLQAAHLLAKAGHAQQAMLELRQADSLRPGSSQAVLCSLAKEAKLPLVLMQAAAPPEGPARWSMLSKLWKCVKSDSELDIAIRSEIAAVPSSTLPDRGLVQLARHAIRVAEHQKAIGMLTMVTKRTPDLDEAWILLGRAHLGAGQSDRALDALSVGAEKNDPATMILIERGKILATEGKITEARENFPQIVNNPRTNHSERGMALRELGHIEAKAGNLHLAVEAYRKAARFGHTTALRDASLAADKIGKHSLGHQLKADYCRIKSSDGWCTRSAQ